MATVMIITIMTTNTAMTINTRTTTSISTGTPTAR